jgi:hypothetical protein
MTEEVSRKCEKECSTGYSAQKPSSRHRDQHHETQSLGSDAASVPKHEYLSLLADRCKPATPLINVTMCAGLCLISPLLLASSHLLPQTSLSVASPRTERDRNVQVSTAQAESLACVSAIEAFESSPWVELEVAFCPVNRWAAFSMGARGTLWENHL